MAIVANYDFGFEERKVTPPSFRKLFLILIAFCRVSIMMHPLEIFTATRCSGSFRKWTDFFSRPQLIEDQNHKFLRPNGCKNCAFPRCSSRFSD